MMFCYVIQLNNMNDEDGNKYVINKHIIKTRKYILKFFIYISTARFPT